MKRRYIVIVCPTVSLVTPFQFIYTIGCLMTGDNQTSFVNPISFNPSIGKYAAKKVFGKSSIQLCPDAGLRKNSPASVRVSTGSPHRTVIEIPPGNAPIPHIPKIKSTYFHSLYFLLTNQSNHSYPTLPKAMKRHPKPLRTQYPQSCIAPKRSAQQPIGQSANCSAPFLPLSPLSWHPAPARPPPLRPHCPPWYW